MAQLDVKVVLLGDSGVGKTSLVVRYVQGEFNADAKPTIGASFWTKRLVLDSHKVALQIWDTAGQERFRALQPMYYRGAHAAVLVFDITSAASFERVQQWVDELERNVALSSLTLVIAANKSDLAAARVVAPEKVTALASRLNAAAVVDTSAKASHGVEQLFLELARHVLARHRAADDDAPQPGKGLPQSSSDAAEGGCSC